MSWEPTGGGERVEEEVELQGFLREEDWEEKGEGGRKRGRGRRRGPRTPGSAAPVLKDVKSKKRPNGGLLQWNINNEEKSGLGLSVSYLRRTTCDSHQMGVCGQFKIRVEKYDLPWFWCIDISLQVMRLKSALRASSQKQHYQQWVPKGSRVESHGFEKWKQGQGRLCCGQLWLRVHHRGGQGGELLSNFLTCQILAVRSDNCKIRQL